MVRESYEKRAEALRLEDEAQELMMTEIVGTKPGKKDRLYV
jgi:hypothetical protein